MNNSSLNTVLLIVIVVGLVAGAVWYFTQNTPKENTAGIEVTLPSGTNK